MEVCPTGDVERRLYHWHFLRGAGLGGNTPEMLRAFSAQWIDGAFSILFLLIFLTFEFLA